MRNFLLCVALAATLVTIGCKTATTPLPSWAVTAPEATAGSIIAGAVATVNQYEADVAAGYVPPASMRSIMQTLQQTLVVAQPAYAQWSAALKTNSGTAEPEALASAVSTLQSSLAQLPSATK